MNGIGGSTISEAIDKVSYPEFQIWAAYRAKRGSLNLGLRMEWGSALLATLYANAHRKESSPAAKIHDFAPHHDAPEYTLDQAMNEWA